MNQVEHIINRGRRVTLNIPIKVHILTSMLRYCAVVFILTAPLLVYGVEIFGVSVRLSRLALFVSSPILVILIMRSPNQLGKDKFFTLILLPFLSYSFISIAWATEPTQSSYRFFALIEVYIVYLLMFFAGVIDVYSRSALTRAYIWSAVIPICIAFWQLANITWGFSASEVPFSFALIPDKYERLDTFGSFPSEDGFSRLSSSFGEPNMFAGYLSTVLLVSLIPTPTNRASKLALLFMQSCLLMILVLTVSKSGLISFTCGFTLIAIKAARYRKGIILATLAGFTVTAALYYVGYEDVVERFVSTTGHIEFMDEVIQSIAKVNYWIGEGIGSYEFGSSHRFVLTRLYEAGVPGLVFCIFVSLVPIFIVAQLRTNNAKDREKIIMIGASFSVVVGLHLYDYFIHLFPWMISGITAAFLVKAESS